jgi:RND family efflux transporter MFP subunit
LAIGAAASASMTASDSQARPPPRQKPAVAVRVASAKQATVPLEQEFRGELAADTAELAARAEGRVVEVRANLGDTFEKGDVLAVIDAAQTQRYSVEAKAQVDAIEAAKVRARAQLAAARLDAERAQRLLAEQLISEEEATRLHSQLAVLEAEVASVEAQRQAARARVGLFAEQLSQARLTAPFAGAVAERYLHPGATVQPGAPVLRLVQSGPLRVRFRVSEEYLSKIGVGVPFELTTLATADVRHAGRIERLSAEVARTSRSVAVEGVLTGPTPALRPGMYATVVVRLGTLEAATLVPAQAVTETLEDDGSMARVVWVVREQIAKRTSVTILGRHASEIAVSPLEPTATVVVFGQQNLADGDSVKATARSSE